VSRRLTALSRPSNERWEDIVVIAEGSEVAGYSVTPSDFAKAKRYKTAIEQVYGASLDHFIAAYSNSQISIMNFLKFEDSSYKKFITSSNNQIFLKAILKRAYKVAEGMTSRLYLLTREITRHLDYDRKNRRRTS